MNTVYNCFYFVTAKKEIFIFLFWSEICFLDLTDIIISKIRSRCLNLTDHLSVLFIILFFKQMIQNQLSSYTATIIAKGVVVELILKNVRYKQRRPSYSLCCKMKWRRSGTHVNGLFHFVFIFSTSVPNWYYCYSKTLNIIVACIGFFSQFVEQSRN